MVDSLIDFSLFLYYSQAVIYIRFAVRQFVRFLYLRSLVFGLVNVRNTYAH